MVAHVDRLAQQPAGVVAQVEDKALQVAEAVDGFGHFVAGGLLELGEMDVADAGTNLVFQVDGGMRNLVANQVEDQRRSLAHAYRGHLDMGALGAFQSLGNLVGGPAVGGFAVDGGDDVAGVNAGAEGGRALVRRDDVDLVALLLDHHADAVIVAALIFAQPGVGLGIVKIGVRIEYPQHAGDGAVVDGRVGLVAIDGLGVVLLHQRINVGERLQAVAKLALVGCGLRADSALQHAAHDGADGEKENHGEKCAAGAGSHRRTEPPNGGCGRSPFAVIQSIGSQPAA